MNQRPPARADGATTDADDVSSAGAGITPSASAATTDAPDTTSASAAVSLTWSHHERLRSEAVSQAASTKGRKAAEAKVANDSRSAALVEVKELWLARLRAEGPPKHGQTAAFARSAVKKFPALTSTEHIATLCARWTQEATDKGDLNTE